MSMGTVVRNVFVYCCETGEIHSYDTTGDTTARDLLLLICPTDPHSKIIHVQKDVMGCVTETTVIGMQDMVLKYAHSKAECVHDQMVISPASTIDEDAEKMGKAEDELIDSERLHRECNLWVANPSHRMRVFFNAYTRMTLGLPMWYLDLYGNKQTGCIHVEGLLHQCLGLDELDDRFALFGNYRSHCSEIDGRQPIVSLLGAEDPENERFLQYMMRPECEIQSHLGITRQSPLVYRRGFSLGSKKFWFALQGTTLFFYADPVKRTGQQEIRNLDTCQIGYHGGDREQHKFEFEIVEANGTRHKLRSHSRRRVEKWVAALQGCHRSCEINDPIDMATIRLCQTPQPHPPAVPEKKPSHSSVTVASRHFRPSIDDLLPPGISIDGTAVTHDSTVHCSLQQEVEVLLRKIELAAETLASRKKLRRKEALLWSDHLRAYMITLLRVDHPEYAVSILPEVASLIRETRNLLDLVEGRSEFLATQEQVEPMIETIMDSANCLFILFKGIVEEQGERCPPALKETRQYKDNKILLLKTRQLLKRPFHRIDPNALPLDKNAHHMLKQTVKTRDVGEVKIKDEPGLLKWFTRMISTRKVQITTEEAQELSMSEGAPEVKEGSPEVTETPTSKPASFLAAQLAPKTKHAFWSSIKAKFAKNKSSKESTDLEMQTPKEPGLSADIVDQMFASFKQQKHYPLPSSQAPGVESTSSSSPRRLEVIPEHSAINTTSVGPLASWSAVANVAPSHRRAQSMKPSVTFDLSQSPAPDHDQDQDSEVATRTTRRQHSERPKSLVEIDQTLLKALLRDTRLAALIQKCDSSLSPARSNSPMSHSPVSHSSMESVGDCGVCGTACSATDVVRTPFDQFHRSCLQCARCSVQLGPKSFRLDAGCAVCQEECTAPAIKANGSSQLLESTPRPLKGILKKPTTPCV